jgi:hypothetical protein
MSFWNHIPSILDPSGLLPVGIQLTEDGEVTYDSLLWGSEEVPKPTEEDFLRAVALAKRLTYRDERRDAYPPIVDQLDMIFHGGIDVWREQIQAVKDRFPKPSE